MSLVEMHHRAKTGHLGGALSCVDVLLGAEWWSFAEPGRSTRIILSKGHAASALYAVAADDSRDLSDFNQPGSNVPEQPKPGGFATQWATGSLGHGLSVGLGFAIAQPKRRIFVILSDGECQEGSVWEAAMLAPALGITNLTAIVDANDWQAIGRTIVPNASLSAKFEAFGWHAQDIPGNEMTHVIGSLDVANRQHLPTAIIAHTKKGAGISFMENDNNWHYRHPSADDVDRARQELGL